MLKFIKRLLLSVFIVLLGLAALVTFLGFAVYKSAQEELGLSAAVEKIKEKENYTPFDAMPDTYVKAVVAVEDRRFYSHRGIDPIGIGRALYVDFRDSELKEGGSTITQQLAKNLYFMENRDLVHKIAECFTALELEKLYTKAEILELYANTIYFGDGYYCVYDASMGYFGKRPADMDDYECTLLAGIPNAPSVYAPTKNPQLAEKRRQVVLKRMGIQAPTENVE